MTYQTIVKVDVSTTYHKEKMTIKERAILGKYGVEIIAHRRIK